MSKITIFSRGPMIYSTQRIQYEAKKRGHVVRIIDHLYCRMDLSQDSPELYYGSEKVEGFDVAVPRIGSSVTYMGSMSIRHCERIGIPATTSSYGLVLARDKLRCYEFLSQNGVDVPRTVYISPYNEEPLTFEEFEGDKVIIKLLEGTQGIGVILAENLKSASSILETLSKLRKKVLVQEFIEESKGADIRIFVVGGKVIAAMKRQAQKGEFRSNIHRGGIGVVAELTEEETEVALKVCRLLKLDVAGVDMLRSNRGPLILEVNPSPGLEGIEQYTKINVARAIIEHGEKLISENR